MSTTPDSLPLERRRRAVERTLRRRSVGLAVLLAVLLGYLGYAWQAFGVSELLASARPERLALLATDAVAHKVHVTWLLRRDELEVAVEGERTSTFEQLPAWVTRDGDRVDVDLGEGYRAEIEAPVVRFEVPDYGTFVVTVTEDGVHTELPAAAPAWARVDPRKFDARPTLSRRVQVSRAKIEIHRFFAGWENFWFPFRSPLHGMDAGELLALAGSGERLDPEQSNLSLIASTFWSNPDWQHGEVFKAILETLLMALLGTMTATLVGVPLAFVAARNFTPSMLLRFGVRRLFDFLRGIDNLIWSLIFIRAFGLGPLTGSLAIAFTDTGTLGKLYSEALENIDDKQLDGVRATGANRIQHYRFGVVPQLLPVLMSQCLYYLEANTRSATVIGALGAGGIGLLLVETIRTSRDWENTLYLIILTICLVIVMDSLSGWLRRRLVGDLSDPG